jgi:hypothetical protein
MRDYLAYSRLRIRQPPLRLPQAADVISGVISSD